jgi:hypothetical protein
MRRLRRLICIACALAAMVTAAWGIRSIFRSDFLRYSWPYHGNQINGAQRITFVYSNRGSLRFGVNTNRWSGAPSSRDAEAAKGFSWASGNVERSTPLSAPELLGEKGAGFDLLGFGAARFERTWVSDVQSMTAGQIAVRVPHWFISLLLFAPFVLLAVRKAQRRRGQLRQSAGLCPGCGYDLRATPSRCPECGTGVVQEG